MIQERMSSIAELLGQDPQASELLRAAHRCGAEIGIDDAGTLTVTPETAVPDALRNQLFAHEAEAVEAVRCLKRAEETISKLFAVMASANRFGTRYAMLPDGSLAIYSTGAPLPSDVWFALNICSRKIADGMKVLGIEGLVGIGDLMQCVREYNQRPARPV